MKEPILESILRMIRIRKVIQEIKGVPDCQLLDIGCGFNHKFLSTIEPYISNGIGIDFKVNEIDSGKIKTIRAILSDRLPFEDRSFDIVTMLAVLEHLDQPVKICSEVVRVLKPGGKLVITVPGKRARKVLEFLSFKLGVVNADEIKDHKKYYDIQELQELTEKVNGLKIITHNYFQLGMNNFCVIQKKLMTS